MRLPARLATAALACALLAACGDRAGDGGTASDGATDEPSTAQTTPVTGETAGSGAIPDDFPLSAGMGGPQDTIATSRTGTGLRDLALCGTTPLRGLDTRDRMVADNSGGESANTRELVLLGSPEEATTLAEAIADLPATCGNVEESGGTRTRTDVRSSSLAPTPAATLVQTYVIDGSPATGMTVLHVVPSGSAVLVTSTYGQWEQDEADAAVDSTLEPLADTVAALRAFDEGSATEPTEEPTGSSDAVPADLPIDVGLPEADAETEVTGPSVDGERMGEVKVCGRVVWPVDGTAGGASSVYAGALGPELYDGREIVVHADEEVASNAMAAVRDVADTCRHDGNQVWTVLDRDTGHDTVTLGLTYDDGLGSSVFQVTRVGSARLMVQTYGEGSLASLGSQADGVTETTEQIVRAMCVFTKTGC